MLVHLGLSVLLTVISLVVFICTVTYELINDDDDESSYCDWFVKRLLVTNYQNILSFINLQ